MRIEPASIGQVDIQPAIVVVVEKRQPASLGFNDDTLSIYAAPHIGVVSPACCATSINWTGDVAEPDTSGFHNKRTLPLPKWSCKGICQRAAEQEER